MYFVKRKLKNAVIILIWCKCNFFLAKIANKTLFMLFLTTAVKVSK